MSGLDEFSDFDLLIDELERAADDLGANNPPRMEAADLVDAETLEDVEAPWARPLTTLDEVPQSLVGLRVLDVDDPLSHLSTRGFDVPESAEPGTVIDHKYEVLGPAPRAADAWEARHVILRQRFVLQLLPSELVEDPIVWPRFQHDIRAAGLLGHENIEFVTDLGHCERFGSYLVKQWLDGPTLSQFLAREGPRPVADAVAFAHTIGEALAALHEIGVIHGRLTPESVLKVGGTGDEVWQLLDVCIPGGDEVFVAPEQRRGEATGPQADQYAVAWLTWLLLHGPDAGVDVDSDAPDELVEVLRRALEEHPLQRWADMDTFVAELLGAVPQTPRPEVHPFDRREATRQVEKELEAKEEAAEDRANFRARPKSMRVRVAPAPSRPSIEVEFNTGARLVREYRRNMLAGAIFVPTAEQLQVGGEVDVELRYPAREASTTLRGDVATRDPGGDDRPAGYGVVFGRGERPKVDEFVRGLGLGLGLSPSDRLNVVRALDANADISAGEAFLLSRLRGETTVGSARAMFAGLPYDFDECLSTLIDEEFVSVDRAAEGESAPKPAPPENPEPPSSAAKTEPGTAESSSRPESASKRSGSRTGSEPRPAGARRVDVQEWDDVERVLETVDYFEERGNYMSAGRILEPAVEHAPHVAAYHHRLALHRARFDLELGAARESIREARRLAPRNEDVAAAERYIATLVELSSVRVAWSDSLGGRSRWVRTEPDLGFVWFESIDGAETTLVKVDYGSLQTHRVSRGRGWRVVAENAPKFDALEHRKRVPFKSRVQRHERQVELARKFGGFGPHFTRERVDDARSTNATFRADVSDGLVIHRVEGEPIRLSSGDVSGALFSPDDQQVAWVERKADRWALVTSPVVGPSQEQATFDSRPDYRWSNDASILVVLDHDEKALLAWGRGAREGRRIFDAAGSFSLGVLPSLDDDTVVLTGRTVIGETRWLATWLSLKSGEVVGEYVLPGPVRDGVVRSDGLFAAVTADGELLVADFDSGTMKTIESVAPIPGSVAAGWSFGEPLVVAEVADDVARVVSVDVDLLCG